MYRAELVIVVELGNLDPINNLALKKVFETFTIHKNELQNFSAISSKFDFCTEQSSCYEIIPASMFSSPIIKNEHFPLSAKYT